MRVLSSNRNVKKIYEESTREAFTFHDMAVLRFEIFCNVLCYYHIGQVIFNLVFKINYNNTCMCKNI